VGVFTQVPHRERGHFTPARHLAVRVSLLGEAEDPADARYLDSERVRRTERLRLVGPIWRLVVTGVNHLSTAAGHTTRPAPASGQAAIAP